MKKQLCLVLVLALLTSVLSGCTSTPPAQATAAPTSVPTAEPTAEPTATPAPTAEPTAQPTAEPTAEPTETPDASAVTGGSTGAALPDVPWQDATFLFDGILCTLPVPYATLKDNGWTVDMARYGYADGYILNRNDKTTTTIDLDNPNYNEKLSVQVGFTNTDSAPKDILECSVWSLSIDTTYAFKKLENVPEITLIGGLTFGSTLDEVQAVLGEPTDVYTSEDHGYGVYTYRYDFTVYLKLTVYDAFGLTAVSYSVH